MPKTTSERRRGPRDSVGVADVLGAGAAKLKKRIRDIERLLKKDNLKADVRIGNERALKALKVELENTQLNLKAKNLAKKYHMVRFFEKKKAIRKYNQAKKQVEEVSKTEVKKDIKKARKLLKHCEIDVFYVILFPKTEKYISLYPNSKQEDEKTLTNLKAKKGMQQTEERKRQFRKECEKLIEENKLSFTIDDIISGKPINVEIKNFTPTKEIDAPQEKQQEEDDDFFE